MSISQQIKKIQKKIKADVDNCLRLEGLEAVKDSMVKSIESEVYSVYTPSIYNRRKSNGGLIDRDNNIIGTVKDGELTVRNVTPLNDDYGSSSFRNEKTLTGIIISGEGYRYDFPYSGVPRDFIQETREDLENNDTIHKTIMSGLKKRGHNVVKE